MSAQHRLPPQAMTAEDCEFDALLRRAAQHSQEVTVDIRRQRNISRESKHGGEANRRFAAYLANGKL
jgi:hypothetical protein